MSLYATRVLPSEQVVLETAAALLQETGKVSLQYLVAEERPDLVIAMGPTLYIVDYKVYAGRLLPGAAIGAMQHVKNRLVAANMDLAASMRFAFATNAELNEAQLYVLGGTDLIVFDAVYTGEGLAMKVRRWILG